MVLDVKCVVVWSMIRARVLSVDVKEEEKQRGELGAALSSLGWPGPARYEGFTAGRPRGVNCSSLFNGSLVRAWWHDLRHCSAFYEEDALEAQSMRRQLLTSSLTRE